MQKKEYKTYKNILNSPSAPTFFLSNIEKSGFFY